LRDAFALDDDDQADGDLRTPTASSFQQQSIISTPAHHAKQQKVASPKAPLSPPPNKAVATPSPPASKTRPSELSVSVLTTCTSNDGRKQSRSENVKTPVAENADEIRVVDAPPNAVAARNSRGEAVSCDKSPLSAAITAECFSNQSSLLRLFQSDMLAPHMAMQYLYKAKEPGVLAFLGA
jgi:hypothetical protein